MKLFKKPFFAILLCIIIVLGATAFSAYSGLNNKSAAVKDSFYDGVRSDGETHDSISSQLEELCDIAYGMSSIAANYGKNTDTMLVQADALRLSLSSRDTDIASVYTEYSELNKTVNDLEEALYDNGLSQRHTEVMNEYTAELAAIASGIASSGYNESVQQFGEQFDGILESSIASLFGITYPVYFG